MEIWKTVWRFLKKLKIEISYDPAIPLLSIYPKEIESFTWFICTPMFIAALFTIAKVCKQLKYSPINRWIKKMWTRHRYIDIHNIILFSLHKREILLFAATWMNLEGIVLSEVSQTVKDKCCMLSHMRNLKKWTKLIETENTTVAARG